MLGYRLIFLATTTVGLLFLLLVAARLDGAAFSLVMVKAADGS